jgi:hypothetical protein
MGTIQNSINGMLGAAAGAATLGKHISNQNKEIANQEAQKELQVKDLEYANQKDDIEYKNKMAKIHTEMVENPLKDKDGNIITDPKEYKQQQLNNEVDTVLKYKSGKRKEAALKSIDALQDEMFTMTDLKFNMNKRMEQIDILKGVK